MDIPVHLENWFLLVFFLKNSYLLNTVLTENFLNFTEQRWKNTFAFRENGITLIY